MGLYQNDFNGLSIHERKTEKRVINKKKEIDYEKMYKRLKKLPKILSIIFAALFFIWSIVDVAVFNPSNYWSYYRFGVMKIPSLFLDLLIWWAIGAVVAILTYFCCAMHLAPTVLRTDAVIEIRDKMSTNANNAHEQPTVVNNDTTKLD